MRKLARTSPKTTPSQTFVITSEKEKISLRREAEMFKAKCTALSRVSYCASYACQSENGREWRYDSIAISRFILIDFEVRRRFFNFLLVLLRYFSDRRRDEDLKEKKDDSVLELICHINQKMVKPEMIRYFDHFWSGLSFKKMISYLIFVWKRLQKASENFVQKIKIITQFERFLSWGLVAF